MLYLHRAKLLTNTCVCPVFDEFKFQRLWYKMFKSRNAFLLLCMWVHRNLFWQLARDGNLHGSGMPYATTAYPKPSFRAPERVDNAVVGTEKDRKKMYLGRIVPHVSPATPSGLNWNLPVVMFYGSLCFVQYTPISLTLTRSAQHRLWNNTNHCDKLITGDEFLVKGVTSVERHSLPLLVLGLTPPQTITPTELSTCIKINRFLLTDRHL